MEGRCKLGRADLRVRKCKTQIFIIFGVLAVIYFLPRHG